MLSSIVSEPLRAVVKPSRLALYYLLLVHGVALWGVLQAGVYIALIGLIISFAYYLRRWHHHVGVRLIQLQGENCLFECAQGASWQGSLGTRHFVSEFLLVVQIQQRQRRCCRYLVLFRDALDAEAFRCLRVRLLFPESAAAGNSLVSK